MKNPRCVLSLLLVASASLWGQPAPESPPVTVAPPVAVHRTQAELDQLLGPIALYPDALIALILPAATAPTDVVLAARYLKDHPNDFSQVESRAWDDSVKSLAHYPEVMQWMDENLTWTKQLGEAFVDEPAEVMKAIQRLRAQARAAGTLVDTPQQQVLAESDVLRIVPTQPEIIYVPRYDPAMIYGYSPYYYSQPLMTFGLGFAVGPWLAYDFDWRHRAIWVGNRHRAWRGHDWRRPVVPFQPGMFNPSVARPWRPPMRTVHPAVAPVYYSRGPVADPSLLPGTVRPTPHPPATRGAPVAPRAYAATLPPVNSPNRSGISPQTSRSLFGPRFANSSTGPETGAPASPPNRARENAPTMGPRPRPDTAPATVEPRGRTYPRNTVGSMPAPVAPAQPTVAPPMPTGPNPGPRPARSNPRVAPVQTATPTPAANPPPRAAPAHRQPAPPPPASNPPSTTQSEPKDRRSRQNEP